MTLIAVIWISIHFYIHQIQLNWNVKDILNSILNCAQCCYPVYILPDIYQSLCSTPIERKAESRGLGNIVHTCGNKLRWYQDFHLFPCAKALAGCIRHPDTAAPDHDSRFTDRIDTSLTLVHFISPALFCLTFCLHSHPFGITFTSENPTHDAQSEWGL